jgi:acyl-coenzyme A thioesterase PaaI-like protein
MTAERKLDPSSCFACSPDNRRGLHLDFHANDGGEMVAEWIPESEFEGFRGIIHGGVVSTVLDEAMAKVVAAAGIDALTAELRVRFRQQVTTGAAVEIRGWIEGHQRRVVRTEATLTEHNGVELAHAWAVFLVLKQKETPPPRPQSSQEQTRS